MSNPLAHDPNNGGLMAKSIGEHYPLIVSFQGNPFATADLGHTVGWYVWNGRTGWKSSLRWPTAKKAAEYAGDLLNGTYPQTAYHAGVGPLPLSDAEIAEECAAAGTHDQPEHFRDAVKIDGGWMVTCSVFVPDYVVEDAK